MTRNSVAAKKEEKMENETALSVQPERGPESLVSILSRMSTNPNFNAESFSVLIAAAERERLDARKAEFATALHAIKSMGLRAHKRKQAKNSKYAPLEDIDDLLAPHLRKHGLTFSFDCPSINGSMMNVVMHISHINGYSEPRSLPMPVDDIGTNKDGKRLRPVIQDHGSTMTYSQRTLLKMGFGVIETDEDDDGQLGEGSNPISQDEADTMRSKMTEHGFTGDDKRRVGNFAAQLQGIEFTTAFRFDMVRKCDYAAVMLLIEDMKP